MSSFTRMGVRPAAGALAGLAVASCLAFAPGAAQAGSIFGSASIITNRPCPAAPAAPCVTNGVPTNFRQFNGGMFTEFSTSAVPATGATAAARVAFGDGYLPTIGVASSAGAATRTGATATAFRSFAYEGAPTIDLALSGVLHYVNSGDAVAGESYGQGILNVVFGIMRLSDFAGFNAGSDAIDIISSQNSFPDCEAGALAAGGYNSLGDAPGTHQATIGLSQACDGSALTLHTGDRFVIVATLQAISNRGGFIDAMNTFSVELDEEHTYLTGTTDLVDPALLRASLNGAVPEPSAWAMLVLGFGALGAALRRRRMQPALADC